MKPKELRPLDDGALENVLQDTYKKLFWLRFKATTEKVESVAEKKKLRQDVARIKTIQRERELKAVQ
ncbi:MAG TPA: 50S ribosomal protein L29 [Planctomycetia bacterium]|jgi:large subunit ribosomal protein L29|nr:50S ribosomal protein L29 [Planctomycetia bacterium]